MNRRQFIKAAVPVAVIPAVTITCEYKDDGKGSTPDPTKGEHGGADWSYRVYCYERQQGEWIFKTNSKGSFASEREYMTFEEEEPNGYLGFMYDGVLHFQTFDEAADFVHMHVRAKDDTNIIDTIYDVYYKSTHREDSTEIQVAHYWYNGDTGNQIHWEADGFNTNFNKIEFG